MVNLFTKKEIAIFVLITAVGFLLTMIIWTIAKNDPYTETIEQACYPNKVVSWERHNGNHLFATCLNPETKKSYVVEVKRKK